MCGWQINTRILGGSLLGGFWVLEPKRRCFKRGGTRYRDENFLLLNQRTGIGWLERGAVRHTAKVIAPDIAETQNPRYELDPARTNYKKVWACGIIVYVYYSDAM